MKNGMLLSVVVGSFALGAVACGGVADEGGAPAGSADTSDEAQLVTTTNLDGTWTGNAYTFETTGLNGKTFVNAAADFTGPTGKTRRMGVCLLRMTSIACTATTQTQVDSQCASITLPTGGHRYCVGPNGSSNKLCAWRDGTQTSLCAGSPANGGTPVAPGTYTVPTKGGLLSVPYISYACFEGCAVTDPSSSSAAYSMPGSGGGCYDQFGHPITC